MKNCPYYGFSHAAPKFSLQVGDQVMLKSGGPTMTVVNLLPDGRVVSKYFDGNNSHYPTLPRACLVRAKE